MLTRSRPIMRVMRGTDIVDAYIDPGDPIGYRHMCEAGTEALVGESLALLEFIEVNVTIERHPRPRPRKKTAR